MLELLIDVWPILAAVIMVIVAQAQMHSRLKGVEDKVKTLFDLHNRK